MSEQDADNDAASDAMDNQVDATDTSQDDITRLTGHFLSRLLTASLRTEAVRAGMVDLDGLKLLDVSSLQLDANDSVVNGQEVMQGLRQKKPWLFRSVSSSSTSAAPSTRPVRQKSAMEMSDEEYRAARTALTKRQ